MSLIDKIFMYLAYRIPTKLVYWCGVRLWVVNSICRPEKELGQITLQAALDDWDYLYNGN